MTKKKQSYRMDLNASICLSVSACSEEEAIKLAEEAVDDFSYGFKLPSGENYSDAVLYTSTEESPEVVDVAPTT